MKVGLVLEGGGMRGLYTAGVIDIMLDHGFEPDVVCGTSAGVTFGVNLLSKQRGRVLRYNKRFVGDRRYISFHSWLTTGNMINKDFAYDLLPRELDPFDDEAFMASKAAFYATVEGKKFHLYTLQLSATEPENPLGTLKGKHLSVILGDLSGAENLAPESSEQVYQLMDTINDVLDAIRENKDFAEPAVPENP